MQFREQGCMDTTVQFYIYNTAFHRERIENAIPKCFDLQIKKGENLPLCRIWEKRTLIPNRAHETLYFPCIVTLSCGVSRPAHTNLINLAVSRTKRGNDSQKTISPWLEQNCRISCNKKSVGRVELCSSGTRRTHPPPIQPAPSPNTV